MSWLWIKDIGTNFKLSAFEDKQHEFHVLPNISNDLRAKFHAWVSTKWKLQKLQFSHLSRDKFDLMQMNSCLGMVFATFAIDTQEFTVEWTHNKSKILPCWNYQVRFALFGGTENHIDNICSMFIWPVYIHQWSHGIFIEISCFSEHLWLEKLFFHFWTKIQLVKEVNYHKLSWGVRLIWFSLKSRSFTLQWAKETRKLCKWEES